MQNLALHSVLRRKMIILLIVTTSLIHFSLKGWENVLFELGSERVKFPFTVWTARELWSVHCTDVALFSVGRRAILCLWCQSRVGMFTARSVGCDLWYERVRVMFSHHYVMEHLLIFWMYSAVQAYSYSAAARLYFNLWFVFVASPQMAAHFLDWWRNQGGCECGELITPKSDQFQISPSASPGIITQNGELGFS